MNLNKRTFYFLMDGVTGKFYTGEHNWLDDFTKAAVYYSYQSVKKRIKGIIRAWEHDQKWLPSWKAQGNAQDEKYLRDKERGIKSHEKVKQWGIQIIEKEIEL